MSQMSRPARTLSRPPTGSATWPWPKRCSWQMLAELQRLAPAFGGDRRPRFAFRFKRMIHVVYRTTIQLVARCMDWAKHRRRKATAKRHVRLNRQSFLPHLYIHLITKVMPKPMEYAKRLRPESLMGSFNWRRTFHLRYV